MALQLVFVVIYFILRLFTDDYDDSHLMGWEIFLALIAGLFVVAFIQYLVQKKV